MNEIRTSVQKLENFIGSEVNTVLIDPSIRSIEVLKKRIQPQLQGLGYDDTIVNLFLQAHIDGVAPEALQCKILEMSENVCKFHGRDRCLSLINQMLGKKSVDTSDLNEEQKNLVERVALFHLLEKPKSNNSAIVHKHFESKMWVEGTLHLCLEGVQRIVRQQLPQIKLSTDNQLDKTLKGIYKHTESVLGSYVEEFLETKKTMLGILEVENLVHQMKSCPWYQTFMDSLHQPGNHLGGYSTYDSTLTIDGIKGIVDTYLRYQIHLCQALYYEKELITSVKPIIESCGIHQTIDLFSSFEKGPCYIKQELNKIDMIDSNVKKKILDFAYFYFFAAIKSEAEFFDENDSFGHQVRWTLMWFEMVREMLIQGYYHLSADPIEQLGSIKFSALPKTKEEIDRIEEDQLNEAIKASMEESSPSAPSKLESKEAENSKIPFVSLLWYSYAFGVQGNEKDLCEVKHRNISLTDFKKKNEEMFGKIRKEIPANMIPLIRDFLINPELTSLEYKFKGNNTIYCLSKNGDMKAIAMANMAEKESLDLDELKIHTSDEKIKFVQASFIATSLGVTIPLENNEKMLDKKSIMEDPHQKDSPFIKGFFNTKELEYASVSRQTELLDNPKDYRNLPHLAMDSIEVPHSKVVISFACQRGGSTQ